MSSDPQGLPPTGQQTDERLPFTPGVVVAKISNKEFDPASTGLTDIEERVLKQAGWRPGDPLPDLTNTMIGQRLTDAFTKVGEEARQLDGLTPVPPDTPPLQIPKARDISELSPAEKAEVVNALKAAKQIEENLRQQDVPDSIAAIPGMAEAYKTASQLPDTLTIVDDTTKAAAETNFNPTVAEEPVPLVPDPPNVEPPSEAAAGSELDAIPHVQCPRCGHFVDTDVINPSDDDKRAFVQAILGGQRFRKNYTVFGGKIAFTLRTLLPSESAMALFQLDSDCDTRRVLTQAQYIRYLQDYRLAMGLEMLHRDGKAPVQLQAVKEIQFDNNQYSTVLPQLTEYIQDQLFANDHVRHVIGMHWAEFQRLTELMEVRAEDSDFWTAIEDAS